MSGRWADPTRLSLEHVAEAHNMQIPQSHRKIDVIPTSESISAGEASGALLCAICVVTRGRSDRGATDGHHPEQSWQ